MTRLIQVIGIGVLVACGGAPDLRVGGRIMYETLEGGFWAINGDDGVTYEPRALGAQFQKEGLPIFATLFVRRDLASVHMVGPVVDVVSIQVVPGFAGAWKGTKSYLAADGTVAAWAPDWPFQIRMTSPNTLQFVNGPAAKITSPSSIVVSGFTFPPSYPPGPSSGICVPIIDTITDGTGTLAQDGSLSLTLNWTHSCGGQTSRSITTYSMKSVAALTPNEISQL